MRHIARDGAWRAPGCMGAQVVPRPPKAGWAGGQWETFPDKPRPVFGGRPGMGGTPQDLRLGFQLALGGMLTYRVAPGRFFRPGFLQCEARCGPAAWGTLTAGPVVLGGGQMAWKCPKYGSSMRFDTPPSVMTEPSISKIVYFTT